MEPGTPRCADAGASCASGYVVGMLPVLCCLASTAAATMLLWSTVRRSERISAELSVRSTSGWLDAAAGLDAAVDELRETVDQRAPR